eukprot:401175-Prymnesium_polylepis.1
MTRKGRAQSRGPLVPFRPAKPEPYVRKSPPRAPTYQCSDLYRVTKNATPQSRNGATELRPPRGVMPKAYGMLGWPLH